MYNHPLKDNITKAAKEGLDMDKRLIGSILGALAFILLFVTAQVLVGF